MIYLARLTIAQRLKLKVCRRRLSRRPAAEILTSSS